jgi:glycerol-3-phosphate dehydrogenase
MNLSVALTAAAEGAVTLNYVKITHLRKNEHGTIVGATLQDTLSNESWDVAAKTVVNATGPYVDALREQDSPEHFAKAVQPSSGTHIVLPGRFSFTGMGLLNPKTKDGRVIFFLPWLGKTVVGTTDDPCEITQFPVANDDEVQFILNEIQPYFHPDVKITRDHVLSTWKGIRPLVKFAPCSGNFGSGF